MKKLNAAKEKEIYGGKTYRCPNVYYQPGTGKKFTCKYTTTSSVAYYAHLLVACPYK